MATSIPTWVNLLFSLSFIIAIVIFYYSNNKPIKATIAIILWSIIHSALAYLGFYHNTEVMPPRYILVLLPSTLVIIYSLTRKKDWIYQHRNSHISTFIHIVRIPVEIVLHQLFLCKLIPQVMTYEGYNFDIIMGITSLIVGVLYMKNILNKRYMILWNVIGLIMIFTILFISILSAPLPFQQFGQNQPNIAVNYFPFILLPATIVPLVIWTHISDIMVLSKK